MSNYYLDDERDSDSPSTWEADREAGPVFVDCPYCDARPLQTHFYDHLQTRHPEKEQEEDFLEWNRLTGMTLRRIGEVKDQTSEPADVPRGMARCPVCSALVPRTRLEEHVERSHSEQEQPGLEACPVCAAEVRANRLEKHLRKVHPDFQTE